MSLPSVLPMESRVSILAVTILVVAWALLLTPVYMQGGDTLGTNSRLHGDDELLSGNGFYSFIMQTDCNLVLYRVSDNYPLWASGTDGDGTSCMTIMQEDGNLVVYSGANVAVWASNTNRVDDNYQLVMQNDGNVVIYTSSNVAIWDTNTVQ